MNAGWVRDERGVAHLPSAYAESGTACLSRTGTYNAEGKCCACLLIEEGRQIKKSRKPGSYGQNGVIVNLEPRTVRKMTQNKPWGAKAR